MSASRQNFEIEIAEQTAEGEFVTTDSREFIYQYPFIDIGTSTRTAEHEPIDEDPVVQTLGPEIRKISIEGHCYHDEAGFIDSLAEGGLIRVISDRWTGYAIVNRADSRATGEGGGKRPGSTTNDRIYEYTLEVSEVTGNIPQSVGNIA